MKKIEATRVDTPIVKSIEQLYYGELFVINQDNTIPNSLHSKLHDFYKYAKIDSEQYCLVVNISLGIMYSMKRNQKVYPVVASEVEWKYLVED